MCRGQNPFQQQAELSSIVKALSFLGPRGPVAGDAHSCIFFDPKHAAGVCLGTIHACTRMYNLDSLANSYC